MQHMVGQQVPPEVRGFNEDLLHYYGLPGFGNGGNTGAKTIDSQAALEAAFSLMASSHAGAHLMHDVGYMDNGMTGSLEWLVVCDEMIQWIKAYMQPLVINEETLAIGDIREVVAADGDFLSSENTLKHFREDWYPRLLDRRAHAEWFDDGATTLRQRARQYLDEILEEPADDILTTEQLTAVNEIVNREE
jgi:trimethylamine--corrinoid protein Co-methyltransferase